jgi:hypothetical protein
MPPKTDLSRPHIAHAAEHGRCLPQMTHRSAWGARPRLASFLALPDIAEREVAS